MAFTSVHTVDSASVTTKHPYQPANSEDDEHLQKERSRKLSWSHKARLDTTGLPSASIGATGVSAPEDPKVTVFLTAKRNGSWL